METNLFFQRIMMEHLFFIETSLKPVETAYIDKAKLLRLKLEQLLTETVYYSNGVVSEQAYKSGEFITPYTLKAEEVTAKLTGTRINTTITDAEEELVCNKNCYYEDWQASIAYDINARSICILNEVIELKTELIDLQSECEIFITLYPEMLEHLREEANYYLMLLKCLQSKEYHKMALCYELNFWNELMGEHAWFIDGMLDPTEMVIKRTAEDIAEEFMRLVDECITLGENQTMQKSFKTTGVIRNFKRSATEALLGCKLKSIIPPLLADHVLREANHYFKLLKNLSC